MTAAEEKLAPEREAADDADGSDVSGETGREKIRGSAARTMSGLRRFLYKYMEEFSLWNQIM